MRGLVVVAACAGILAGCSPVPSPSTPPKPLSQEEAEQRVHTGLQAWWRFMSRPDEPMPMVEPIEYVDPTSGVDKSLECFTKATGVQSVTYNPRNGYWSGSDGERLTNAQNRTLFICTLEYPYDLSVPSAAGMYSEEELAWAWTYQQTRLVPCLKLMGYDVDSREGGHIASTPWWNPYDDLKPTPSPDLWDRIDDRCPPSPYGPTR